MLDLKEYLEQTKTVLVTQDAFDELVKKASAQPERKTGHWIPCSERLPNGNWYVLVTDFDETTMGRRYDGRWVDCYGDKMKDVTAWMPLPEAYKEGES